MSLRLLSYPRPPRLRKSYASLVLVFAAVGCTGTAPLDVPGDAGTQMTNHQLIILPDPGPQLGLAYRETKTLRVRYESQNGIAIGNAEVRFALARAGTSDSESAAGSTLSAEVAITDREGVATVDLTAGAATTRFKVIAEAAYAAPATFIVSVNDQGFTRLEVRVHHDGWRPQEIFSRVEIRVYRDDELSCESLSSLETAPPSPFSPASLDRFGATATFQNLSARYGHTVLTWAESDRSSVWLSAGCAELTPDQLPPGRVELTLAANDRMARIPDILKLDSSFDITPLRTALEDSGATRMWQVLACDYGIGQALIDCTLAAMDNSALGDCVANPNSDAGTPFDQKRGDLDSQGCRAGTLGDGSPSLDRVISEAVAENSWPAASSQLIDMLERRNGAIVAVHTASELAVSPSAAQATHELKQATVEIDGETYSLNLAETARPVLVQSQIPVAWDLPSGDQPAGVEGRVRLGDHGFTLRYGLLARTAFEHIGLAPLGVADRSQDLGTALLESIADSESASTGCQALSAIACRAVAGNSGCLYDACSSGALALDRELNRWWKSLSGTGLDLSLAGNAILFDRDHDLVIEGIGREEAQEQSGIWTTQMTMADGSSVDVVGGFGGSFSLSE